MSGCPNGCGQHHIANIGFTGASIKVGERTVPAYIPLLAGNFDGGDGRDGAAAEVAASRPSACRRRSSAGSRTTRAERVEGEAFNDVRRARIGTTRFEELVADLSLPPEFSLETMNQFIDWNRTEPFVGGPGGGRMRGLATRPDAVPDLEDADRRGGARAHARAPPPAARARLLLPEGGGGADRHADAPRARPRGSSRSTPGCSSPRPTRPGARSSFATACASRSSTRPAQATPSWSATQCCSAAQGRRARAGARRARRLDHRACAASRRRPAPVTPKLAFDERRGIWKANPIADWDAAPVWDYIARHDVPYNPLHDRGYESIGCVPCTLPGRTRRALGR